MDLVTDWEPLGLYDVFLVQGVPKRGWIHDYAVWSPCAAALQPLVDAMEEPTGVRSSQSRGGKGWLAFPQMTWSEAPHRLWTTKWAKYKHDAGYWFSGGECSSPAWAELERRHINPRLDIRLHAAMPCDFHGQAQGARHSLVLALRDGWVARIGEERLRDALTRVSSELAAYSVARARRADVENLVCLGHPRADEGLREGETMWHPIVGIPVTPCVDPIPLPAESATTRTFTHADGRRIAVGLAPRTVIVKLWSDADEEPVERRRPATDPAKEANAFADELLSDGFVEGSEAVENRAR